MTRRRVLGLSAPRFVLCAAIVLVAIVVAPYALFYAPINSADLILWAAPLGLLYVGWPRSDAKAARRRAVSESLARADEQIEADGLVPRRRDRT